MQDGLYIAFFISLVVGNLIVPYLLARRRHSTLHVDGFKVILPDVLQKLGYKAVCVADIEQKHQYAPLRIVILSGETTIEEMRALIQQESPDVKVEYI